MADYYKTLEIKKDASAEEIKKAYRKLALKHHPDRNKNNPNAENKFKEASEAYAVLSDPQKKRNYDQFGSTDPQRPNVGSWNTHSEGVKINFGDFGNDIGDLFNFGNNRRGSDVQVRIQMTLNEIAKPCEKQINFQKTIQCSHCKGLGGVGETCPSCAGYGKVKSQRGFFSNIHSCQDCHGKGQKITKSCSNCKGKGHSVENKTVSLSIPPGINENQGLRVKGQGNQDSFGKPAGDLIVYVMITPHAVFARSGADLHCEITISYLQLCLGAKVNVQTIHGNKVELTVPPGTQSGKSFRLKEKGLPSGNYNRTGDQYVKVKIRIPAKLPDEAKELLKKFQNIVKEK